MLPQAAEAILHRIGEAVARLPEAFVTAHHRCAGGSCVECGTSSHEYQIVDPAIEWNTLAHELPVGSAAIQTILGMPAEHRD